MLGSAALDGTFAAPLRARIRTRAMAQGARVKSGLGIAPLRATSPAPGFGLRQEEKARSALLAPPAAGAGVLSSLRGQVRSASPLVAGVRPRHRAQATPAGALQARQAGLLARLRQIDNGSRLLQASAQPLRRQGGFALKIPSSTFDLLA